MVKMEDVRVISRLARMELDIVIAVPLELVKNQESAIKGCKTLAEEKCYTVLMWKAKCFTKNPDGSLAKLNV